MPIGVGVSLSRYVAAASEELESPGLETELHAWGTNVSGDYDDVCAALRRALERLHGMGVPRVTCTIKLGSRTDREQSLTDKVESVRALRRSPSSE